MLGKPITKQQAVAIKKILTGESKGKKPTRNGRAKTKKKGWTKAEVEVLAIFAAAALIFGFGYYYVYFR